MENKNYGFATVKREFTELFKSINDMRIELENKMTEQENRFKEMETSYKAKIAELNDAIDKIMNN